MTSIKREHPKVFISYSHDSPEHMDRVLELSKRMRQEGIDCHIDQYEDSPPEGWPRWMTRQIEKADFVLVICTETYDRRFRGIEETGKGLGVKWEGAVVTQELYDAESNNTKFIPAGFSSADLAHIPVILRGANRYDLITKEGYEALYRRLTGQPRVVKPNLGEIQPMPPLVRKQNFLLDTDSSPDVASRELRSSRHNKRKKQAILTNRSEYPFLSKAVANAPTRPIKSSEGLYLFHVFPFGERGSTVHHDLRSEVVNGLVEKIRSFSDSFDYIACVERAGDVWAQLVAHDLRLDVRVIRERGAQLKGEISTHQKGILYDRDLFFRDFKAGDRVIIVDDVVSTGQTAEVIIDTLKELRVSVVGVFCIVVKGTGASQIQQEGTPVECLLQVSFP